MGKESEDAVDEILKNLDRIPKDIITYINIDKISKALANELNKKMSL